jgi:EAL domain-containing protein (putative c-di-GMP-specific phosphodiesterase class I)
VCTDTAQDPRVDDAVCRRLGIGAMVCVPLRRGAEAIGVLKVAARRPTGFPTASVDDLSDAASFLSVVIATSAQTAAITASLLDDRAAEDAPARQASPLTDFVAAVVRPGIAEAAERRRRVEQVLRDGTFTMVCQPVVDLRRRRVAFYEALARFQAPPAAPPDVWFSQAEQAGLGVALELAAVRRAVQLVDRLDPDVSLCVNVGPRAVVCDELHDALADAAPRVVVGYSGLARILELAPDVIKLDRALIAGIDGDGARQALGAALVGFAQRTGAEIVAEGVETTAELDTVSSLGVRFAQGYALGAPLPLR